MGQLRLDGADPATSIEALVSGDLISLAPMRMRYTLLLNEAGGIVDDLMALRWDDGFLLVVNAARKAADFADLSVRLGGGATIARLDDRALLALQGPASASVLSRLVDRVAQLPFMAAAELTIDGASCLVTRSGYTGEDGFEISLPAAAATALAERLLANPEVEPIGLGARDSLRLEAGFCLWGHDIDETTTPVEADLAWTIGRRKRSEGGFPGAAIILRQLAEGPARKRVGLRLEGPAPAREGAPIVDDAGHEIGRVTSGGFGPSVGSPIAIGYVEAAHAAPATRLSLVVRGASRPARVAALPFLPHRYYRPHPGGASRRNAPGARG
jgi:aminomethyltransferase